MRGKSYKERWILASASPRRLALLKQIGMETIEVYASEIEEKCSVSSAQVYVERLSRVKVEAIYKKLGLKSSPEHWGIVGADTVVVLDGSIMEKPRDKEEAEYMLKKLMNRVHEVYTGVTLKGARGYLWTRTVKTKVSFGSLDLQAIRRYIETGEPMDKAGAYGIQGKGAIFVKGIEGSYSNVVGLPLYETYEMIRDLRAHWIIAS